MNSFRFVCRDDETNTVIDALKENHIVLFHCQTNSGLTHFLKHVMRLLWDEESVCFYIDGEAQTTISEQIIGQTVLFSKDDSIEQNKATKLLKKRDSGDVVFNVITSCLYALDAIPTFPNIGTIANALITSIRETIDVDQEHICDFKTEKAVINFFTKLKDKKKKDIILLIDNPQKLTSDEYSYLHILIKRFRVRILLPFNTETLSSEIEFISKNSSSSDFSQESIYKIAREFERPDNKLIKALYKCYGADFVPTKLDYYEKVDRNIHIIMADILGLPISIDAIDDKLHYLLKVLVVVGSSVPESVLFPILRMQNIKSMELTDSELKARCNYAQELGALKMDFSGITQEPVYTINKQLSINSINQISFVEKQSIVAATIQSMDMQIDSLSPSLLEFAISHLEHDYTHAKEYILAHAHQLYKKKQYSLLFLDKLNYFDSFKELVFVAGIYYDHGVYDKPYRLLKAHNEYSNELNYRIAQALICERLHTDNYVQQLETLVDSIEDFEKKCLLVAVLFVAYLNTDNSQKYKCVFDKNHKYYYLNFVRCKNYYYLLRNVSYYMDDITSAMYNYEKCLSVFSAKDPINYNRTISNYICFLMRNGMNERAKCRLLQIAKEAKKILDYNDPTYLYLNNNYGIYLMKYTDEDPSAYFLSIPFSTGTTETPYIYAQVNLALYYLKFDPILALHTLDNIEVIVLNSSVPRTKQFYVINRALVEYANGIFPKECLKEITDKPLRGNVEYAKSLCEKYYSFQKSKTEFDIKMIDELCLPGYIFYRYFPFGELLS